MLKVIYSTLANSWVFVENREELSAEEKNNLKNILQDSIEDSWEYDDSIVELDEFTIETEFVELDGSGIALCVDFSIKFIARVSNYDYDPGQYDGPMEDCYPETLDFEEPEIKFNDKKFYDLFQNSVDKYESLKQLDITVDPDCRTFSEYEECYFV